MRPVGIFSVRVLGAYIAASNVTFLATMLATLLSLREQSDSRIAWPLAAPGALTLIGLAMLVWSRPLGALLASGLDRSAPEGSGGPAAAANQMLRVGTALLGLYFLAIGLADAVAAAWDYFVREAEGREAVAEMRRQRMVTYIVRAATSLVVGGALLWMARGVFVRGSPAK